MEETQQDVNKIIETVGAEWARQSIQDKQTIAILTEELRVTQEKLKEAQQDGDSQSSEIVEQ